VELFKFAFKMTENQLRNNPVVQEQQMTIVTNLCSTASTKLL
jgi:hypothetical protein